MTSIRRRLLSILLATFAVGWLVLAVLSFFSARHEIEELFDAELAQSARVLLGLTLHEIEEAQTETGERHQPPVVIDAQLAGHKYEEKLAFQIWSGPMLLLRSPNAPTEPLSLSAGYSDRRVGGKPWRVFSLIDTDRSLKIDVGEHYDVRDELIYEILGDLSWPLVLTLPFLAFAIGGGITRALVPLKATAAEIGRRSPQQLSRIDARDTPVEVQPLVEALNDLLGRLQAAFEGERRFTANASHELRTPLAGLKAQAQVALRASDDGQRRQALTQIVQGVDRATHLVEQLLMLARLDPDSASARYEVTALVPIARDVIAEQAPAAVAKGVELSLSEQGHDAILADRTALSVLLRNLIDNAIRYTDAGGQVQVSVTNADDRVVLAVRDTGPGVPADQRPLVLERFYRVPGTGASGCGLGLSIAKRIVELHGATLELADAVPAPGLEVRVRFSAVAPAA